MNNKFRVTLETAKSNKLSHSNFVIGNVVKKQFKCLVDKNQKKQFVLNVLLRDETAVIPVKFYNNVNGFNSMINLSSVLKIVRPVVFTINTEDEVLYEINITTSQKNPVSVSDSGECFFDAKVPPSQNYMYINQINSSNVFVSLVCVVKMVFPEKLVKTKNGSEVRKRSIIVTDLNCSDFYINFWGDDCDICYNLEPKQTIAHFWNLRVNEYNNKLDGKYVFETIITIAPKMQAMYELQVKLPLLQQQWANERVGNIEMKPSEIVDYFKLFQFPQLFSYGTRDIYGKTIAVITKIEAEIERSLSYYCNECHMYCASTEYCSECNTTNVSPSLKIYVDLIDESGCLTKIPLRGWVALKFMGIGTKEFENEQLPVEQIKTVMTSSNFLDNISTLHLFKRHCLVFKVFNHKMTVMELEPMNKFEIQERFIAIPCQRTMNKTTEIFIDFDMKFIEMKQKTKQKMT